MDYNDYSPFEEGQLAWINHQFFDTNPYPQDSSEYWEWADGWDYMNNTGE